MKLHFQCFNDNIMRSLFTEDICYQILMDLLYENGKYDDVLQIFNEIKSFEKMRNRENINVIVLATYYRMVIESDLNFFK